MASIGLINMISTHSWRESEHFHVLVSRLPSLNDCVVTRQNVLDHFHSNCHIFFNCGLYQWSEDNYCHSQRIEQLIKEKLLKGIFKVDWLINVAANTQMSPNWLAHNKKMTEKSVFTRLGVLKWRHNCSQFPVFGLAVLYPTRSGIWLFLYLKTRGRKITIENFFCYTNQYIGRFNRANLKK